MAPERPGSGPSGTAFSTGCLFLFGLVFFLAAAALGWQNLWPSRGSSSAWIGTLVVLVLAGFGIGLMVLASKIPGSVRAAREREARHPGEPWLWREDWEQGFAWSDGRRRSRFRMTSMPGVLGGRLQGRIETNVSVPAGGSLELILDCVSWRRAGRDRTSEVLWQERSAVALTPGSTGAVAIVDWEIPFDLRATDQYGSGAMERVCWRLTARALNGGFKASFTVPVFQTAGSDPSRTCQKLEEQAGARLAGYSPAAGRIEKEAVPDRIRYRFPRGRNPGMAAVITFFGLLFSGIAVALILLPRGSASLGAVVMALAFGFFGLIALWAGVWQWFAETRVTARSRELCIHTSCLGFSRTRVVRAEEIRGFQIKSGMQKGEDVWYDVRLELGAGKTETAGSGMDKTEAEWFVAELRGNLGIG